MPSYRGSRPKTCGGVSWSRARGPRCARAPSAACRTPRRARTRSSSRPWTPTPGRPPRGGAGESPRTTSATAWRSWRGCTTARSPVQARGCRESPARTSRGSPWPNSPGLIPRGSREHTCTSWLPPGAAGELVRRIPGRHGDRQALHERSSVRRARRVARGAARDTTAAGEQRVSAPTSTTSCAASWERDRAASSRARSSPDDTPSRSRCAPT